MKHIYECMAETTLWSSFSFIWILGVTLRLALSKHIYLLSQLLTPKHSFKCSPRAPSPGIF